MASKKFSNLSPMQQAVILACFPAVLALVVFYDLVMPLNKKATVLKSQLTTLHAQNVRDRMLEAQHTELLRRVTATQKELQGLQQIVPDRPAHDQFVKTVYGAAASSAVYVRSLAAAPPARQTYFTAMPFHLRVDGTYYSMLNFFARLADSARIVNVSDLVLGPAKGQGGQGTYKIGPQETVGADCVLTTFYNSPPLPPPPGPGSRRR